MNANDVTPALMIKNEEHWIHYVLRDLLSFFNRAVILDTGSTDQTRDIVLRTARMFPNCDVMLIPENYENDANKIGNGRNVLRSRVETYWMMLVDGDEIWTLPQLEALFLLDCPQDNEFDVGMVGGRNIEGRDDGSLLWRIDDVASYDRLFSPDVKWVRTDYPFESHHLENRCEAGRVFYFDHSKAFHWHVRHTNRSGLNQHAFFRKEKQHYYPYKGRLDPLPAKWLGAVSAGFHNPYRLEG